MPRVKLCRDDLISVAFPGQCPNIYEVRVQPESNILDKCHIQQSCTLLKLPHRSLTLHALPA